MDQVLIEWPIHVVHRPLLVKNNHSPSSTISCTYSRHHDHDGMLIELGEILPRSDAGDSAVQTSHLHKIAATPSQTIMEIVSSFCSWQDHLESVYTHQKSEGQVVPLYDISKDLFEDAIGPEEAATKIASCVCVSDDFQTAYLDVICFIIGAANNLSDEHDLSKLANLTLALSRLPDARNETRTTIQLSFDYKSSEIGPGEVVAVDEGKIWADLPQFAVNLGDSMYGMIQLSNVIVSAIANLCLQVPLPISATG